MKYTIDYGFGEAILYTPYEPKKDFILLPAHALGSERALCTA